MIKQPEYITEIEDITNRCAAEVGVDSDTAKKLARNIAKCLSYEWAGLSVYFLKGYEKKEKIKEMHQQIIDEYNGVNARELAKKYDISEVWVYRITEEKRDSMLTRDIFEDVEVEA